MFISESNLAALTGTSLATTHSWAQKGIYKTYIDSNGTHGFMMEELLDIPEVYAMNNSNWYAELNPIPLRQYNSLELFAGGGGLALGMEKAGFNHILLNEYDKSACNTLRVNRPEWNIIEGDVRNIDFTPLKGLVDFISGGFPCQAFSFAGKQGGFNDTRGTLFFELARAVKEIKPKVFMGENVKGLVSHDNGKTFETICNTIKELGYTLVEPKVLKGIMYQVPQKRERIILIAIRNDLAKLVKFNWPSPYRRILTLRDALYKSEIYNTDVPASEGATYPEKKRKVLELVPQGGDWRNLPADIAQEYLGGSWHLGGGKTGMARRLSLDEPSLTLTCSPAQKQTERCHPLFTRPLSVREYARIQTFPDDWLFQGTMSDKYKQIGNAVPVNLSWAIGRSLIRLFNDIQNASPEDTPDCRKAIRDIINAHSKLAIAKNKKDQTSIIDKSCRQLNLFDLFELYGDSPVYTNNVISDKSYPYPNQQDIIQNLLEEKNVLVSYVKNEKPDNYINKQSTLYFTGKRFPSNIELKSIYYFMPYFKGIGIRDIYIVRKLKVGNYSDDSNKPDYRLAFEIELIGQLLDDYVKIPLKIWRTYSNYKLKDIIELQSNLNHKKDRLVFNTILHND